MIPNLRKPRPRALTRRDQRRQDEATYRRNREIALARDRRSCRICGAAGYVETHHVKRRSSFGLKRMLEKHDPSNLLTVCAGIRPNGVTSCHDLLTGNVLKAFATTERGTNGPVEIQRWSDSEGGYVVQTRAA